MAAKERRRIVRANKANENKSPVDMGEELPPFMIPPRYKLMFKMMQNDRNNTRLHRKEIPLADKEKFA